MTLELSVILAFTLKTQPGTLLLQVDATDLISQMTNLPIVSPGVESY